MTVQSTAESDSDLTRSVNPVAVSRAARSNSSMMKTEPGMCANGGQFWRANCRQQGLVFLGGNRLERCAS